MSAPLRHALLVASLALCVLLSRPAFEALAVAMELAPGSSVLAAAPSHEASVALPSADGLAAPGARGSATSAEPHGGALDVVALSPTR